MNIVELGSEDIEKIMQKIRIKYEDKTSGIELIKVNDGYQLCTKKEYYEYIYPLFDNRAKPSISNAALETLSIIAYNTNRIYTFFRDYIKNSNHLKIYVEPKITSIPWYIYIWIYFI